MKLIRPVAVLATALLLLSAGGCASRGDLDQLRTDVDNLSSQVELNTANSVEALQVARSTAAELAAIRLAAEAAQSDAAATRQLLEDMDARMADTLGGGTLK